MLSARQAPGAYVPFGAAEPVARPADNDEDHRVTHPERPRLLVVDDYGTGGLWFVVVAASEDLIHETLPKVKVYPAGSKPEWMSEEMRRDIETRRTFDLEDLPASDWMNRLTEGR